MNNRIPFWQKVDQSGGVTGCWPWTGYVGPSGHGMTSYQSLQMYASRKAWILTHGPIRGEWCVNHRCDNAACCNPAHLYLGTRADNMLDRWALSPADERGQRGRPTVLDEEQLAELWKMRREGVKLTHCAQHFGVHVATICRYITAIRAKKSAKLRAVRMSISRETVA
jgi:hypothetical protein